MQTEPQTTITSLAPQRQKELFDEILRLYDLSDDVLAAVVPSGITNRAAQENLARPLVKDVTHSIQVLSALYTEVARRGRMVTPDLQDTLERAFSKTFLALKIFADRVEEQLLPQRNEPVANVASDSVEALDKKSLGYKFREGVKAGTLQSRFKMEISSLNANTGAPLVQTANNLGDQLAGVAAALDAIGMVAFNKAVPEYGPSTTRARKGGNLTLANDEIIIAQPREQVAGKIE